MRKLVIIATKIIHICIMTIGIIHHVGQIVAIIPAIYLTTATIGLDACDSRVFESVGRLASERGDR